MRGVKIEQVIGERIRELREGLGISQAELGNRLPLPWPRQAVSAAEKGRRAFAAAELANFATTLGVGIADLVGEADGRPNVDYVDKHATLGALRRIQRELDRLIDDLTAQDSLG